MIEEIAQPLLKPLGLSVALRARGLPYVAIVMTWTSIFGCEIDTWPAYQVMPFRLQQFASGNEKDWPAAAHIQPVDVDSEHLSCLHCEKDTQYKVGIRSEEAQVR